MKKYIHLIAGFASVSGLGFLVACLMMGAFDYLLPLAVWMTGCAFVSIITKPLEVSLKLDNGSK